MGKKKSNTNSVSFSKYVPPVEQKAVVRTTQIEVQAHKRVRTAVTYFQSASAPTVSQVIKPSLPQNPKPSGCILDEGDGQSLMDGLGISLQEPACPKKRKRTPAIEAMQAWLPIRDIYLEEMVGLEGRGEYRSDACRSCQKHDDISTVPAHGIFECMDCNSRELQCHGCVVDDHRYLPMHTIRKWNGKFFQKTSLKELGVRVQLGHRRGERCIVPETCHADDFVIIDITGIHSIGLDFCGCGNSSQSHVRQLLRSQLFPGTSVQPRTAATFRLLKTFELLSYESKVSALEFYQTIARLSNNLTDEPNKDRYPVFLRVVQQWRHLRMMKRAGRGHDASGVQGTEEGECALLCPACPHPGKNMPQNWESAPEAERHRHALFVALDANFRLKRKNVSSDMADPGLNHGYAYFVEERAYKSHLQKFKNEEEPKTTCSRHDAVLLSGSKPTQGYAATGVATIECSRHDMKRPNAIGDLQRGERYCNMDYMFSQSLRNPNIQTINISYDIACQWSRHLFERLKNIDPAFFLFNIGVKARFLVPKFHLPAHIEKCRTRFSFNYTPGVGRTDGEAPERGWAEINPLAASTREMGPGSRRDTLDYHFGDYNWRKIVRLGRSLLRKLWDAAYAMAEKTIEHEQLESTIPLDNIQIWLKEVETWEHDPESSPNPFEHVVKGPTQAAVRRRLSEEEARALAAGKDFSLDEKVTPSVFISTGVDLEAEQRTVKRESLKLWEHAKDRQRTQVQLRLNALQRKIDAWTNFQRLYMPSIATLRYNSEQLATSDGLTDITPYDFPLWLPSQVKSPIPVDLSLANIEWQVREAQAHEALDRIRRSLQMRAHLFRFKYRHVRGQKASTTARNAIGLAQSHIDAAVQEYRAAYAALDSLSVMLNKTGWALVLRPLLNVDVRELSETEHGRTEGSKKVSWIWRTLNPSEDINSNPELKESVKIEWCKSRARARGFKEEVDILMEEMNRVRRFFIWKEGEWKTRGDAAGHMATSATRAEALRASAYRQAGVYRLLRAHCELLWKPIPAHISRMQAAIVDHAILEQFIADEYEVDGNGFRKRKKRKKVFLEDCGGVSEDDAGFSTDEEASEVNY